MDKGYTKVVSERTDGKQTHKIIMQDRNELSCEGIVEIVGYNENEVVLETPVGRAMIGGVHLSISSLSVESGCVKVYGNIRYIEYKESKAEGFLKRMLR